MKKTIRWGVIGCGSVTEIKSVPAYQEIEGFEVASVMRRNLRLAKDYAKRHGVKNHSNNADDLIHDPGLDAIYIATPPDSHHFYALKVAEAGKICCIEKPMAPSHEECDRIMKVFKKKNLPLFVAYYRRSLPRFKKIRVLIENNTIGDIRHVNWQLYKPASAIDISQDHNWRTDKQVAYGGYFDDLASHGLDLFIHLLGNVEKASGVSSNQQGLYTAMDTISGNWIHENGITGSGHWNFGAFERKDEVEIIGDKGKIVFSVFDEKPVQVITSFDHHQHNIDHPKHIQYHHVKNMKETLIKGIEHPSTGETATHTSWVMDKILGKIK